MKVLLVGEFSGLHKFLKEGLLENGVSDVKLLSYGDGWKKITGCDFNICNNTSNIFLKLKNNIELYNLIRSFSYYDVVQLINPLVFNPFVNLSFIKMLKRNSKILSLVAAGSDLILSQAYLKGVFEYYAYDYDKTYKNRFYSDSLYSKLNRRNCQKIQEMADYIIPCLYEYSIGYEIFGFKDKLSKVIPFPINIEKIQYEDNHANNKLVFFHGLNRELSKGTPFIKEALMKLKRNYPNDVDVIIDGHMPYDKYIEVIKSANVIVDQCCGYGYGINACISMAQGKVVMSGCRKETMDAFDISEAPIINTMPDVDYLYKQMLYILENRKIITNWGYQSRKYVEELHDYRKVAQKYIEIWNERSTT